MTEVRTIFKKYGVRPRKRFGQNFLVQDHYIDAIVNAAELSTADDVVEIGAGFGNLTSRLARRAGHVTAIEFDRDLARALRGEVRRENVEIIEADALEIDFKALIHRRHGVGASPKTKVVANLPYNIATELIFRLLEAREDISSMLLMTQLEVARRLVAGPGGGDYGVLSVLTGLWADRSIALAVPAGAFFPKPKVDSAVVKFDVRDSPKADAGDEERFKMIVKGAFARRRKTIANALSGHPAIGLAKRDVIEWLGKCGIDPVRRPETLTIEEFARLSSFKL